MTDPSDVPSGDLEGGSYEIVRARLVDQANGLAGRVETLNAKRQETFGGRELSVIGNERVRTENNCVPRDIVMVEGQLLFGYNVFIGLRTETRVEDVFSLHQFRATEGGFDMGSVQPGEPTRSFLEDSRFVAEFSEVYRYYKDARLVQLTRSETKLLAVFQIGGGLDDKRVFRWALDANGRATYVDNRGERDHVFPPSHDFQWVEATLEDRVVGPKPLVNVADEVFVELDQGKLTLRVEDNTESGEGIYREALQEERQSLDDSTILYAKVGHLCLLKVLPYNERTWRYLVYSSRVRRALRIDAIGGACVSLPDDHGIMFPGGYFLMDGQYKVFDGEFGDYMYERSIRSPNGEDVLYVFHERDTGKYALFSYNLIRKEVENPILCHGYSLFSDGRMVVFRQVSDEPTRVHPMQFWQTPFVSAEYAAREPERGGALGKIGNAELVRGISDCLSLRRLVRELEPSRKLYEDLIAAVTRILDAYYWLGQSEIGDLAAPLAELRTTAELIVDEFDKVEAIRARTLETLKDAGAKQEEVFAQLRVESYTEVQQFMNALTELNNQRGRLIGLRELRYIDLARVEELEAEVVQQFDRVSAASVAFLLDDSALEPISRQLERLLRDIEKVEKAADLVPLSEELERTGAGVTVLGEVVGALDVADATERTRILERISEAFGSLNRVRATLKNRKKSLQSAEGRAEFAVQFKLLAQNATGAVGLADTPEACDARLSRLMVQFQELEARFSEYDEFVAELADKRDEIYEAFSQKKQQLVDDRQRRAQNLLNAAERILQGIERRGETFKEGDALNAYFASDPMVLKLRDLAERLRALGEGPRAEEIESKLKQARQNALRGFHDREELFEGENLVKLGRHRFAVNTQPMELTLLLGEARMDLALSGTDFRESIEDADFNRFRDYWTQALVSETEEVYRGEYLAACILFDAVEGRGELGLAALHDRERSDSGLEELVRRIAAERYDEGYERGLHDADAAKILQKVLSLRESAGLLRFEGDARAVACWFWAWLIGDSERRDQAQVWRVTAMSLGRLRSSLGAGTVLGELGRELGESIGGFLTGQRVAVADGVSVASMAGHYLAEELSTESPRFVLSREAAVLRDEFNGYLDSTGSRASFESDLRAFAHAPGRQLALARRWLQAFAAKAPRSDPGGRRYALLETAVLLVTERVLERSSSAALTYGTVEGLLGDHPRIRDGVLPVRIDEFERRLGDFVAHRVPGFRAFRQARHDLLERERGRLRLDEFKPRVLTSFVRNRLINEVYLPLVGENFAKQIGAAGSAKRTDSMGLLLLISPPGYGKTTLMEYVANTLGMVFMKVNGPALGHGVRSLDPEEAPNATSRQEVDKINLALEMGNNVMLYLDDIQHTHPELLQKFISLCDAQRRIEGVWRGRTRTYDLRGKRFCVVMAGNPYTESGEKFQIPDMLANRADTYNLGDVLVGKEDVFALSYIENAVTSNPVLSLIAARSQKDVYAFIRRAQGLDVTSSEFEHDYSAVESNEAVAVLERLFTIQRVLLRVNQTYIASASMDDRFRTEPPFKLQGSYRNMNKLAEKVVAVMNEKELQALLDDHYAGEAQTLTTGTEQNVLKLAELRGVLTPEQADRWEALKKAFKKHLVLGGSESDPATRVTAQLGSLGDQLENIRDTIREAVRIREDDGRFEWMERHVQLLEETFKKLGEPKVALTVQNEPPPGIEELLSMQIQMIERTLVPFVRVATQRLDDSETLRKRVDEFIEEVKQMDQRLRGALGPTYG